MPPGAPRLPVEPGKPGGPRSYITLPNPGSPFKPVGIELEQTESYFHKYMGMGIWLIFWNVWNLLNVSHVQSIQALSDSDECEIWHLCCYSYLMNW